LNLKQFKSDRKHWNYRRTYLGRFLISLVLLFTWVNDTYSQQEEPSIMRTEYYTFPVKQPEGVAVLDQPVDPLTYKLGPGDKVSIFLWGNIQTQYNLTVSPEGKLLVPMVGPIEVSGMYLLKAKQTIEKKVLERFKNVKVVTELTDLRSFKVFVGGAVKYPGMYSVSGVDRVSDAITMAGGFANVDIEETWQRSATGQVIFPPGIAAHRNIIIKHNDGSVDTADVLLFEQIGDLKYDFKLSDGDEIFVPVREDKINLNGIFGGVKNPAFYEYSHRDSLTDLINLAHGFTLDVDSSTAELVRFGPDGKTITKLNINLKEILTGKIQDIKIQPDDRVFIKKIKNFNEKHQVRIVGEVKFPGYYAIIPDSTYLTDVIERAGDFTPLASLAEAEMTRYSDLDKNDSEFERLKQMEVSDMTDLEYEYFKVKSREKQGRIAVDFAELFQGSGEGDIKLRDGDVIVIPRESEVTNVTGEVANPGLLAYDPDLDYLNYIGLCGGFTFRADKGKVRIIKGVTGEWKKAGRKVSLRPGDIILIPEKQKSKFWKNVKDVMAFTANLATVYLVIREATR
jgi:polysaccharide export outer membrane protein